MFVARMPPEPASTRNDGVAPGDAPLREATRPNRLFARLAEALALDGAATEILLAGVMTRVDATPLTLTLEQLAAMRPGLLTLIDAVFSDPERQRVRDRLDAVLAP